MNDIQYVDVTSNFVRIPQQVSFLHVISNIRILSNDV